MVTKHEIETKAVMRRKKTTKQWQNDRFL